MTLRHEERGWWIHSSQEVSGGLYHLIRLIYGDNLIIGGR